MIEIIPQKITQPVVTVPGSKSYTHRLLIASALSDGPCRLTNCLRSEDTSLTLKALKQFGVAAEDTGDTILLKGTRGILNPSKEKIYLGNSGTSMRLLTSVAALGQGTYTLCGTPRMHERPLQDLIEGLASIGVTIRSLENNGCPPVEIQGGSITGTALSLDCHLSSQFLSSLLLIAPYTPKGLEIKVVNGPVSKPYVDMTVDIMEKLGIRVEREGYQLFRIPPGQVYRSGDYTVETDCSQAGYFWGAAAIAGCRIKVSAISPKTRQGDVRFAEVLGAMGCDVVYEPDGITVIGGRLRGIEVDMADMPDIVPTLAVVAAFAEGTTVVKNVAHLKEKESDRLGSVATELRKLGVDVQETGAGLVIQGKFANMGPSFTGFTPPVQIKTYDDHRIAMSFSLAGLKLAGIQILDEKCVEKSFPNYWEVFEGLFTS